MIWHLLGQKRKPNTKISLYNENIKWIRLQAEQYINTAGKGDSMGKLFSSHNVDGWMQLHVHKTANTKEIKTKKNGKIKEES